MPKFSKREALASGWQIFKNNWLFLIIVTIISFLVGYAPTFVSAAFGNQYPLPTLIFGIVFWILGLLVGIGVIKIALALIDGKKAELADLFSGWRLTLKFLLVSILVGVIVLIGVILLVIPGIIFGIRLQLAPYYIVDKNAGPLEALKLSWQATRGSVWNLFVFNLLLSLVSLLGALALGVGLLVATPVTTLAMAWVYRKLQTSA